MLRGSRVCPRPSACILANAFTALFVVAFLYCGSSTAQAQSCSGTEQILVEAGHPMLYRTDLVANASTPVESGHEMLYIANAADPGAFTTAHWMEPGFTTTGWATGNYGVGYETGVPSAAALFNTPQVPAGTLSIFTRAEFLVANPAMVDTVLIGADYDDGVVVWINGVEVFRSLEMPGGGVPAWDASATPHESSNGALPNYGTLVDISGPAVAALVAGPNLLAVGVWNNAASSTDLVLVPKLSISSTPDWTRSDFDATDWSAGAYGVGYETSTPSAAGLFQTPQVPAGTFSVFTRTEFEIVDTSTVSKMFIGADYDDGYVAYINGVEVFGSLEMPFGILRWRTDAASHESSNGSTPNYGTLHDISARAIPALTNGTNILAVGVWNFGAATSTDLVLVPRLSTGELDPCDGIDNDCDGAIDEGYPNTDGGATADCIDPDDDNDGVADGLDCAPLDVLSSSPPPLEVRDFRWVRSDVRTYVLTWRDQGFGVVYNLAGGLMSQLVPDSGVAGAVCIDGILAGTRFDDTRPNPPLGDGYYYIVRAEKMPTCGKGSYGVTSTGNERVPTASCP